MQVFDLKWVLRSDLKEFTGYAHLISSGRSFIQYSLKKKKHETFQPASYSKVHVTAA